MDEAKRSLESVQDWQDSAFPPALAGDDLDSTLTAPWLEFG